MLAVLEDRRDVCGVGRIHEKESAVVCPVIDVIDWNTFEYLGNSGEPQIGGFDWRLVFTWHTVPERERALMRSPVDVIRSGCCSRGLVFLSVPHCIKLRASHMLGKSLFPILDFCDSKSTRKLGVCLSGTAFT
jgi:hypothetical protein